MQSETMSVQKLFQDRRQYRVPFFQRPYVWNKEDQWEPLWADIAAKAEVRVGGDQPAPHFLGAAVLEPQRRIGLLGVEALHIIDGQQRLTTLQYFLCALGMVLREQNVAPLSSLIEGCLWNANTDTMQQPDIEIFKVWPTFRDRINYRLVMTAVSPGELRDRFRPNFTQSGDLRKIGIDHPPALESIWYFREQIAKWAEQDGAIQRNLRLNAVSEAVLRDLQLVSISLGEQDDAQIIFETLNGRGAQLHATDLIRNFIFMRADREGASGPDLFDNLWSPFEADFWTQDQRRGRLLRPRLEWFMQSMLQAVLGDEVEISRLYANYRRFVFVNGNALQAERQLHVLNTHAASYRQLVTGIGSSPIAIFGRRTANWDASTTHPLALRVADSGLAPDDQTRIYDYLTSYLVRRAICGLTAKNYNKIFVQQLKKLSTSGLSSDSVRAALAALDGDASRWPRTDEFRNAWVTGGAYPGRLDSMGVKTILAEIETAMRSVRSEEPFPGGLENLDVDHILPTSWFQYWPLADGSIAQESETQAAFLALLSGVKLTERQLALRRREEVKITIGNLTLAHYGINRSLQNREFSTKREKFFAESNLHLNRSLMRLEKWDETQIATRGQALFDIAIRLWRGPDE
jgi:hypothetical protein